MRKLSITLIAAMLFATGSLFANDVNKGNEPTKSLSEQIGALLEQNSFSQDQDGKTAEVIFILNNEKEIVVLSVNGADETLGGFIKARLNYKAVEMSSFEPGKKYAVQVRITV